MHAILQLQEKLEALELAHNGEERPNSESSVHASGMFPTSLTVVTGAAAAAASTAPSQGAASTGDSQCSSFWWLPCVSVDEQGNSFFSEKKVGLRAGTASGIGALSELIPSTGEMHGYEVIFTMKTPLKYVKALRVHDGIAHDRVCTAVLCVLAQYSELLPDLPSFRLH